MRGSTRLLALLAVLLAGAVTVPSATGEEAKGILLLHTYGHDAPGRFPFDAAFAREIRQAAGPRPDLYIETLDTNRFKGPAQVAHMRAYLRERYADKHLAAVVAVYDGALAFVLEPNDPLFTGVSVGALLTRRPEGLPERVSPLWSGATFGKSVALALKLHPRTRHIALVDGAPQSASGSAVYDEAVAQVQAAAPGATMIPLRNLRLDEVAARLRTLPPDSVILLTRQLTGRRGEPISHPDAVSELARVATAPVYVGSDQLIGTGAVGGVVISLEGEARRLAQLAIRIVEGSPIPPPAEALATPMFDWRQLQRWGIRESDLPVGSVVQFRQPGVWEQYRLYILGALLVVGLESATIAGLLAQRARQRRTEIALRESGQQLRRSYDQNRDLAGRLINAQEAERRRIARDLHDDVSQQLAGLGLLLSSLKGKLARLGPEPDLARAVTTLRDRMAALARAIRNLSHELHPSVLQHAGLAAALERHCADVGELHHLDVHFTVSGRAESIGPDLAICLFRVAQEALANVVRHANASSARLELTAEETSLVLRIADDGAGFSAGAPVGGGLGWRFIAVRIRLVTAHGRVHPQGVRATTVLVRVPLDTRPAADGAGEAETPVGATGA